VNRQSEVRTCQGSGLDAGERGQVDPDPDESTSASWRLDRGGLVTSMLVLVVSCAAIAAGVLFWSRMRDKRADSEQRDKRQQRREALVRALEGAAGGRRLVRFAGDGEGRCAVGVDDRGAVLAVEATSGSAGTLRVLGADDLVGTEVIEHVWTEQRKAETEVRVGSVELKVFVADLQRPLLLVAMLDAACRFGSKEHRAAREAAFALEATLRAVAAGASAPSGVATEPVVERTLSDAERERARQLAARYLHGKGRGGDELAGRQVRGHDADPVR
jgi:hypothetical protein